MKNKLFILLSGVIRWILPGLFLYLFLLPGAVRVHASEGILSHAHVENCYTNTQTLCTDHVIESTPGSVYANCTSCAMVRRHSTYELFQVCSRFGYGIISGGYYECTVCHLISNEWQGEGLTPHFYDVLTLGCPLEEAVYGIVKLIPNTVENTSGSVQLLIQVTPVRPDLSLHETPYLWSFLTEYGNAEEVTITENGTYSCQVRTTNGMDAQSVITIGNIQIPVPEPEPEPEPSLNHLRRESLKRHPSRPRRRRGKRMRKRIAGDTRQHPCAMQP